MSVLVWHFDDDLTATDERGVHLHLENLPLSDETQLIEYRIDDAHSNSYTAWKEHGGDPAPARSALREIRARQNLESTHPARTVDVSDGSVELQTRLPAHSVALFVLHEPTTLATDSDVDLCASLEIDVYGEPNVFLSWEYLNSTYVSHYLIYRTRDNTTMTFGSDRNVTASTFVDMDVERDEEYTYTVSAVGMDGREVELAETRVEVSERTVNF
ncbi:hypothetical protein GCM10009000_077740 [Halobacterium noricense]|uniref:Fibronectin type-III domain-containing protein n=1 Tax=Haladaptatus pallidirubidus TaxID=1008152 RepID=A0AAV3UPG1_9EURY